MNDSVTSGSKRLTLYHQRVIDALDKDDRSEALAHLGELAFIANRLWNDLARDDSFPPAKEE